MRTKLRICAVWMGICAGWEGMREEKFMIDWRLKFDPSA